MVPAAAATTAPDPAIEALYVAWADAFGRGDVEAVLALVTPDYELWAPGRDPIGYAALRPMLEAAFATYEIEPGFERVTCLRADRLAIDCGWDVQHLRPRQGGDPRTLRQRVFVVLRQGPDGRWQFARGMSQPGPSA
jgi:uncharacterized protein (TIGR02246 family)